MVTRFMLKIASRIGHYDDSASSENRIGINKLKRKIRKTSTEPEPLNSGELL